MNHWLHPQIAKQYMYYHICWCDFPSIQNGKNSSICWHVISHYVWFVDCITNHDRPLKKKNHMKFSEYAFKIFEEVFP